MGGEIKEDQNHPIKKVKSMDVDVDRISRPPDEIIHHIVSFLPTIDAVRMSLLSRHWTTMWYSPALEFSEDGIGTERLHNFVEQCLKNLETVMHLGTKFTITSFKTKMSMSYRGHSPVVDRWLCFIAAQPHLEELHLNLVQYFQKGHYGLPEVVLNVASLTILKLEHVKLKDCYPINLPSLKSLSIREVEVEDEELSKLVMSCPSLEKLYIDILSQILVITLLSLTCLTFRVQVSSCSIYLGHGK